MFRTLIESAPRRERRRGGTAVSLAAHALIISGLVAATATGAAARRRPEPPPSVTFIPMPPPEAPRVPTPRVRTSSSAPATGPRSIALPVAPLPTIDLGRIPTAVPPIDVPLADPRSGDEFRDRLRSGPVGGPIGGSGLPGVGGSGGDVLDARGVDRVAALQRPTPAPRYPETLRGAHVEGRVVLRAVVDTLGRLEPGSLTVLHADHDLFAESVRNVAARLRFTPAMAEGRRVRMLIELPFEFRLSAR